MALRAVKVSNYRTVIYGYAALMVITNIMVNGLLFPWVNSLKGRAFAEKIGSIIKPGDKVGIYSEESLHNLNFYSHIKRFENLRDRQEVAKFLSGRRPAYVVVRKKRLSEIGEVWQGDLKPVLEETGGSKQWLLLYSHREQTAKGFVGKKG